MKHPQMPNSMYFDANVNKVWLNGCWHSLSDLSSELRRFYAHIAALKWTILERPEIVLQWEKWANNEQWEPHPPVPPNSEFFRNDCFLFTGNDLTGDWVKIDTANGRMKRLIAIAAMHECRKEAKTMDNAFRLRQWVEAETAWAKWGGLLGQVGRTLMTTINKVLMIGQDDHANVFVTISYEDGKLSMTGVVGPYGSGNCHGSCGQIDMTYRGHEERIKPAEGWDLDTIKKLFAVWDRWHMNDTVAGSPAQMQYLRENPVPPSSAGESHYVKSCAMLFEAGLNPAPDYLHNGKPYYYGHAWLSEKVPDDVVAWLDQLPAATCDYPWAKAKETEE